MKNIFLALFLLAGTTNGTTQNLVEDLQKMRNAYSGMVSFGTDINVKVYEAGKLTMTKKAAIKKDQHNCFYRLDQIKMLINDRYSLLVNEEEKVMVLRKIDTKEVQPEQWQGLDPAQAEKLLAAYENWNFVGREEDRLHYRLFEERGLIRQIDLFLDGEDYTLRKLIYRYNEDQTGSQSKVVITYGNFRINPEWPAATFSEKQFVQKRRGKWIPHSTYRGYELIESE